MGHHREKRVKLESKPASTISEDEEESVHSKGGIEFHSTLDPNANKHLRRYRPPEDRPVRIYADGIYDLFHYGHARSLEQAKKLFPRVHLLVGVCNDQLTVERKGRTVMDEQERAESLRHCRWVDEVVEHAPWTIDDAFMLRHRIDFVAHDDLPYPADTDGNNSAAVSDVYGQLKATGRFIALKRTAGISTSDLITRIVRDYDQFVRRNLQRGISPRELNLSLLRQGEFKVQQIRGRLKERLEEEEQNVKRNWEESGQELAAMLQQWEGRSQELIRNFARLFSRRRFVDAIKIRLKSPPNTNKSK